MTCSQGMPWASSAPGAARGENAEAELRELAHGAGDAFFVGIAHRYEHRSLQRQDVAGSELALGERHGVVAVDAHDLAG